MARRKRDATNLGVSLEDLSNTTDVSPIIEIINEETDVVEELEAKGLVSLGASLKDITAFRSYDLLASAEKKFYEKRMAQYLRDFELNKSSDIGIVHRVIMEEIYSERIYQQMLNNPAKDFSEQLTQCSVRYQKALETLGANRDKRLRNKEMHTFSIADLALEYAQKGKEVYEKEGTEKEVEEALLRQRKDEYFKEEVSHFLTDEEEEILNEPVHGG
jgi:hypothetical protein